MKLMYTLQVVSETSAVVTPAEPESGLDIREVNNPAAFRYFLREISFAINFFQKDFMISIPGEPEKPTFRAVVERAWRLDEVVTSLDPGYKPKPIDSTEKSPNYEERNRNERERMQGIVDQYNAGLFNKLLEVSEAYLFGDKRLQDLRFQAISQYVSKDERPDRKRRQVEMEERARNEPYDQDKERLARIAADYGDPLRPCKTLRELLEDALENYQKNSADPRRAESYSKLLDYIQSKKRDLLTPSTKLGAEQAGKLVYIPQLNSLARVSNTYLDEEVGLHLDTGGAILPLSNGLMVIPYEKMFLPKAPAEPSKVPEQIENGNPAQDRSLIDFLNKLLIDKQKIDPGEAIKVPGGISSESSINLITQDMNPFELTRRELLDAGYVFINALGGGEKYIIQQVIEIDGETVDLGKLPFLTDKQLRAALDLDKHELEEAGIVVPSQEIAEDMIDYLHGPFYFYHTRITEVEESLKQLNPAIEERVLHDKAKEQVGKEWKEGRGYYYYKRINELVDQLKTSQLGLGQDELRVRAKSLADQELVEDKISKEDREMPLPLFFVNRGLKYFNGHCPFLNCGHRFRINNDLTFEDDKGPVRLSTVVAHLAYHGLSERGNGLPRSIDQRYMTITEYYKLMMEKN